MTIVPKLNDIFFASSIGLGKCFVYQGKINDWEARQSKIIFLLSTQMYVQKYINALMYLFWAYK